MSEFHIPARAVLDRLAFTRGLKPEHLDQIARIAVPIQWDAAVTVFREGDRASVLYIVDEGSIAIEISVPGRGGVTVLTVGSGEVFGWSSLVGKSAKTASARTALPTTALAIDADRLRNMCDADPSLGYLLTRRILDVVSERLKATRIQLVDIYGR